MSNEALIVNLIKNGSKETNVLTHDNINQTDAQGMTILMFACKHKNLCFVKEILNFPEGVESILKKDEYGQDALYYAVTRKNINIINELLKHENGRKLINNGRRFEEK